MIYPFLTAILPGLIPGKNPELTVAQFDDSVREYAGEKLLSRITLWDEPEKAGKIPVYAEYLKFLDSLKYRIAVLRAEKLKRPARFNEPEEFFGEIDSVLNSAAAADPVEREKIVDAVCWCKLDDLEVCHDMDADFLCIYRLKLAILQKYSERNEENGRLNFEAAVNKLAEKFNQP